MSSSVSLPSPLRVLVVDDEELACRNLKRKLLDLAPDLTVDTLTDPRAAVCALRASPPDVLFVDVRMPELSGFELLAHFEERRRGFVAVFCTAHDEHAARAFEVSALDYLVKPVDPVRLGKCLARIRRQLGSSSSREDEVSRARSVGLTGWLEHVIVRFRGALKVVAVGDVVAFASEGHQAVAYTADEEHVLESSLVALEAQLDPARFVRCHRAHLVQIGRIALIERESVSMDSGRSVPLSRRMRAQVLRAVAARLRTAPRK